MVLGPWCLVPGPFLVLWSSVREHGTNADRWTEDLGPRTDWQPVVKVPAPNAAGLLPRAARHQERRTKD